MHFELTIPPQHPQAEAAILTVDAPNWLAALKKALSETGEEQIPKGKAVCEVKEDGSIIVRNAIDGRRFYIRATPTTRDHQKAMPKPAPEPKEEPYVPHGTMTYLEAELKKGQPTENAHPRNPKAARNAPYQAHPCMVFDRQEIERRLKQHQNSIKIARDKAAPSPPAMVRQQTESNQAVKFIKVVEVDRETSDTLASLRVDLDALRKNSASTEPKCSTANPPAGFEWIEAPLESALSASNSVRELAERALRISLAALPSRMALFLTRKDNTSETDISSVVGQRSRAKIPQQYNVSKSPLEIVLSCGMSMVLDNSESGQFNARDLTSLLGYSAENALLAAITNGANSIGILVLADSLSGERFESEDLAVANFLAARIYPNLEYWSGAAARALNR